jgi:hypothetical protein
MRSAVSGMLRRVRGALGTAVMWAIAWSAAAFVITSAFVFGDGDPTFYWMTVVPITLFGAVSGLAMGALFSVALGSVCRDRPLNELRPLRIAVLSGGIGLLIPSALFGVGALLGLPIHDSTVPVGAALVLGAFAAVSGGGTVKLAQLNGGDEVEGAQHRSMMGMADNGSKG